MNSYLHRIAVAAALIGFYIPTVNAQPVDNPSATDFPSSVFEPIDPSGWRSYKDSPTPEFDDMGGLPVMQLPCEFNGIRPGRISWDWRGDLDMSASAGAALQFYCADPGRIRDVVVYFRSGGGFYRHTFTPDAKDTWHPIYIDKSNVGKEGSPEGWGTIDLVRISVWPARDGFVECYATNLLIDSGGGPSYVHGAEPHSTWTSATRYLWAHSAYGIKNQPWQQTAAHAAKLGYNGILANVAWAGQAFYASDVSPVSKGINAENDYLSQFVNACEDADIEAHAWIVALKLHPNTPADFRKKLSGAERLQVHYHGGPIPDWICPTHPDNQKLIADTIAEIVSKYQVDGIHLDYIRYPDEFSCFCNGCRERFEAASSNVVANWPKDVFENANLRDAWNTFRRDAITNIVVSARTICGAADRDTQLSAAVLPVWPREQIVRAQDWGRWCERDLLDFVCTMNYVDAPNVFEAMTAQQKAWSHGVPLYPGIGASLWKDNAHVNLRAQIEAARSAGAQGYTIFNFSAPGTPELLESLD